MKTLTPFLVLLLVVVNIPLIHGGPSSLLVFDSASILDGEWWRLVTHPFVHVSPYHFALDACAFLSLWLFRPKPHRIRSDLSILMLTGSGSLAAALIWGIPEGGFCGLSGMAHGLMVFQGVSWMRSTETMDRRIGLVLVILTLGKSIIETIHGTVLFAGMHRGEIGLPVVSCHLGGSIGGLLAGIKSNRVF